MIVVSYKKILRKGSILFVSFVLLSTIFSTAFVQAGAVSQGWNFLVTGYAVDESGETVFEDGAYTEEELIALYTSAAGFTPDSPFYFIDTMFTPFQSPESLSQERLGEIYTMVHEGNYEDAAIARKSYEVALAEYSKDAFTPETTEEFVHDEYTILLHDAFIDVIYVGLFEAVETGAVTEREAALVGIDAVQREIVDVRSDLADVREEYTDTIAVKQSITSVEAELALQTKEEDVGVSAVEKAELKQDLGAAGVAYVEVQVDLEILSKQGELTAAEQLALEELSSEIRLHLEAAEEAYELGFYGEAEGEFADCERLLLIAEELAQDSEGVLGGEHQGDLADLEEIVAREDEERKGETQEFLEDYEGAFGRIVDDYPERYAEIEAQHEQYQNMAALMETIDEQFEEKYQSLLASGMTEAEAAQTMEERMRDEYLAVYGEPYIPPGFSEEDVYEEGGDDLEVIPIGEIPEGRGGYLKDYTYTDPVTGYTYYLTDEGYHYETLFIEDNSVAYDEDFFPEEDFKGFEGTETYSYTTTLVDGEEVTYTYSVTGYTATFADGIVKTYSYPEGEYTTLSGDASLVIEELGFELNPVGSDPVPYEYSPEFENYVSVEGDVYVPPGGKSWHTEVIGYEDSSYAYLYSGEVWTYDQTTGVWTSDVGEIYVPYVTSVAPTGHEHEGSYTSSDGVSWTYDQITGEWDAEDGRTWAYYPDTGTWRDTDTGVSYNPSLTYQTYYHSEVFGDLGDQVSYETDEGVTWSYSEDTKAWVSSRGETYYVPTTEGYNYGYSESGQLLEDEYRAHDTYYGYYTDTAVVDSDDGDAHETWSYDQATQSWVSSLGYTYYTPASENYYSPDSSSGGASTGSGTTASGVTWTYDSTTGSWTSSTGETHAPTYESYSYSYTTTDGSTATTSAAATSYSSPSYSSTDSSSSSSSSGSGDTGGHTGYSVFNVKRYKGLK